MEQEYFRIILKIIQLKNTGVFEHTLKVRSIAGNIYDTLQKNTDLHLPEKKEIENAAVLHDVGKVYIPDFILDKVLPLTAQEIETIRLHPEWGVDFIKDIPCLLRYKEYILFHHILDGYPQRLVGSINPINLPVGIKLLIVADVFAALVENRPYRKAVNSAAACWIIKKKLTFYSMRSFPN